MSTEYIVELKCDLQNNQHFLTHLIDIKLSLKKKIPSCLCNSWDTSGSISQREVEHLLTLYNKYTLLGIS